MFWARLCAFWEGIGYFSQSFGTTLCRKILFFSVSQLLPFPPVVGTFLARKDRAECGVKGEEDMRGHTFAVWADSMLLEL